jgi:hypothetical protein
LQASVDFNTYGGIDGGKAMPVLADLDGDGDLDVFINVRKMGVTTVLTNNGDGTLAEPPVTLPASGSSTGIDFAGGWGGDVADIDGDGQLDTVVGDHVKGAHVWLNQGAMSFAPADSGLPGGTYNGAGLADLNGDSHIDVVFGADQFGTGFDVVFGDGAGGWTAAPATGLPPFGGGGPTNIGFFSFADYDEDGAVDIFAFGSAGAGTTVWAYRNSGDGSFSAAAQLNGGDDRTSGNPVQGSVGDVDCDGVLDIATGGTVHLGAAGVWTSTAPTDAAEISHLADMDGDGWLDLVTHSVEQGLVLYRGDGSGSFVVADVGLPAPSTVPPDLSDGTLRTAYGIDIGDIDGNGALDIVRSVRYSTPGGGGILGGGNDHNVLEVWIR